MKFYGKIGFFRFGKRLEDEDYDVFFCDTCIMWAALLAMEGKLHDGMHIVIQSPEPEVVKEYTTYDSLLEDLWKTLTNVPMNPDTEDMEEDWFIFPKGTSREEIWYWFDEQHSKGIGWIMENIED